MQCITIYLMMMLWASLMRFPCTPIHTAHQAGLVHDCAVASVLPSHSSSRQASVTTTAKMRYHSHPSRKKNEYWV